ncbi:MAG: hypothetical protein AAGC68_14835, partial [Verrucomicrobiota bacterium]
MIPYLLSMRLSRHILILFAASALLFVGSSLHAQETEAESSGNRMTDVQFPNTPIPVILLEYERLTGKRVIRDVSIQDRNLSIQTSGQMTYEEAADF